MSGQLGRNCVYCGSDDWRSVDNKEDYIEFCTKCSKYISYHKATFLDYFQCDNCGCKNGTLQDNDENIAIKCNNCNNVKIVINKHYVSIDNRKRIGIIINNTVENQSTNIPHCPKCNSTSITATARGVNAIFGFIGASKTVNRCINCGYTWKPHNY